jgi:hypothetical protein
MMVAEGWKELAAAIEKWLDGVLERPTVRARDVST